MTIAVTTPKLAPCECGRPGEYQRSPVTNRIHKHEAWCRDCYENQARRRTTAEAKKEKAFN